MTQAAFTIKHEQLRDHAEQQRYWLSTHRFNTVPAGRRSGKTMIAKRRVVRAAYRGTPYPRPRFFCAAPTHDQARRIFWEDLKLMIPSHLMMREPLETRMVILLKNGSEIHVLGMDKPERIEGNPWDGGVLDEYANMKARTWGEHVRPSLSDRNGWCDMIGVPEGRNHYYKTHVAAEADQKEFGDQSRWGAFHWKSSEILPPEEIEEARKDLDELTFRQEYEADFVNFEGQCYYPFDRDIHVTRLYDRYDPDGTLIIMLDFNVDPGVAAIGQEMKLPPIMARPGFSGQRSGTVGTGLIGEVWIPRNSNTQRVCNKLIADWSEHRGLVLVYGDATGGARAPSQLDGTDWDIVRGMLRPVFKDRLRFKVKEANPPVRSRLNAMNTRLRSLSDKVRMMVDGHRCPHMVEDFEGVRLVEGGSGEIDKKADLMLTHLTDAIGYYIEYEFPVRKISTGVQKLF